MEQTATATNPTEAAASTAAATSANTGSTAAAATEESATLLATAGSGADTTQQTQNAQTQTQAGSGRAAEAAASATTTETTATETGAPEKYEFKAPDGKAYDPTLLEAFAGAAKEANLTQDAAQKLIEKMAPAIAARTADQVKAVHDGWLEASKTDKEFGGEKLPENLGVARKALDTFATPELRALLNETALGNHPEVVRMFYRVGKAIGEDKFVGGNPAGSGKATPAAILYDKTAKG